MDKVDCIKISKHGAGLTNQLFFLVRSIVIAIRSGKQLIVIDKFLLDFNSGIYKDSAEIFDFCQMTKYLHNKYGLSIMSKDQFKLKSVNVRYGLNLLNSIDVSHKLLENLTEHSFILGKDMDLNKLFGDPYPNVLKKIYISYQVDTVVIYEIIDESDGYAKQSVEFDISKINFKCNEGWIDKTDDLFDNILKHIFFAAPIVEMVEKIAQTFALNEIESKAVNIIHLRLEDDGLTHWSKQNHMECEIFKDTLENKYIEIIKKYIKKDEVNIILSHKFSNRVISYLNSQEYKIITVSKDLIPSLEGREVCAIIDLLVGEKLCTKNLIGNFNLIGLNGSTFSYLLYLRCNIQRRYNDRFGSYNEC